MWVWSKFFVYDYVYGPLNLQHVPTPMVDMEFRVYTTCHCSDPESACHEVHYIIPSPFQHKELQVMFGHIKKVYIDKSGESGDIWLQASSGMYLLPFENVSRDYKDKLIKFLNENGINPKGQVEPIINTLEEERNSL